MRNTIATSALLTLASSKCTNFTRGFTDSTNDGCEWYDRYPEACGAFDTADFKAKEMCCACDGGITHAADICTDTNGDFGDLAGDKCSWYAEYPDSCGLYDTEDFIAKQMCCACEGGKLDTSKGATDSTGDSCAWYKDNKSSCGFWDTETFKANEMCGACDGGIQALNLHQVCWDTNNGEGDVTGDKCDWYERNPGWCGNYDTETFKANEMCCSCSGGSSGTCYDTNNGAGDVTGDKCDWYNSFPESCGSYDTEDFKADDMCCICGGGDKPSGDWKISSSGRYDLVNLRQTAAPTLFFSKNQRRSPLNLAGGCNPGVAIP